MLSALQLSQLVYLICSFLGQTLEINLNLVVFFADEGNLLAPDTATFISRT